MNNYRIYCTYTGIQYADARGEEARIKSDAVTHHKPPLGLLGAYPHVCAAYVPDRLLYLIPNEPVRDFRRMHGILEPVLG